MSSCVCIFYKSFVLCPISQVVNYWAEKGVSGFTVYKFRLKRLEGQPSLTTNQVFFGPTSLLKLSLLVAVPVNTSMHSRVCSL